MDMTRRFTLKCVATALAGMTMASGVLAQPGKPVTLMVPYPAGGLSDVIARLVSPVLAKHLDKTVIVENLGGAGGAIAAQKVLNSPADGNLIYQGSPNELILTPMAVSSVKYKAEDFRPVQTISLNEMMVFARKDLPVSNGDELAAYAAKVAREGKPLTYASVGVGSFYHLLGGKMSKDLGIPMTHVPYKGGADAFRDLVSDQVDIFITPYSLAQVEFVKQGKVKAVAALTPQRQRLLPDTPTTAESKALKNFQYEIGTGYFVKRDTPEPIVQALHKGLQKVLTDTQLRAGLFAMGQEVSPAQTLAEADRSYKDEIAAYRAIAKAIGLQPGQ